MNTNHRSISLQSGQALAVDRQGSATLFLAEGEVLIQAAAEWLGGRVVMSPARRIAAPATLPGGSQAIVALGAAKLQVAVVASPLEKFVSAWHRLTSAARLRFLRLARS